MKNLKYAYNEVLQERECDLNAVCSKDQPVYSLREVTIFGLEVLSKYKSEFIKQPS